jgi:uncharacterized protein (TIGR00369 family)
MAAEARQQAVSAPKGEIELPGGERLQVSSGCDHGGSLNVLPDEAVAVPVPLGAQSDRIATSKLQHQNALWQPLEPERAGASLDISDPKIAEVAGRFRAESGGSSFLDRLKIHPVAVDKGTATFEVTVDETHLRTMGIAHGGLVATLLDSVLGCACWTLAPPAHHLVTVQLNINYIRPAWLGEKLSGRSEVRHAGQMTAVARGEVRTAEGALVASASGTFMYLPLPGGPKAVMEKHDELERWKTA